jgi:uncharacterized protein (TIGR03435 family)
MIRFILLTAFAAFSMAQSFEVAAITPCPPGTPGSHNEAAGVAEFVQPGGRFVAKCTTLKFMFEWAYDLVPARHGRGPEWFETERYDILAKAEGDTTVEQMKRMAMSLLAERFHLKFHVEMKEAPVFIIAMGKASPRLVPSEASDTESLQMTRLSGANSRGAYVTFTRFSMQHLADTFSRQMDRPILDQTNLPGEFNFALELVPEESQTNLIDPSTLMAALREQLGLTFRADKAQVAYYVIDGADKVAAGN